MDAPRFPDPELQVDFGAPAPGSSNPMPATRRAEYEERIRLAAKMQADGAAKAAQLFIH